MYVSRNDRALGFSSLIAGASRLGRPDIADLTPKELERLAADPRLQVIDVSDVRGAHEMGGMKGHGYWYANDWISTDVMLSLRYPITPEQRCPVNPLGKRQLRGRCPTTIRSAQARGCWRNFRAASVGAK